jgi:hypothetical protein
MPTSPPIAAAHPSAGSCAMPDRARITVTAPPRPSASPTQRNRLTRSPTIQGAIRLTRIGCRQTMIATPPAETPMVKAM